MQSLNFTKQDESNQFPALIEAVMHNLDFKRWGFEYEIFHSGTLLSWSSAIIFQSEFCKVRVWTFRDYRDSQSEIYYTYGRLHAPNEKHTMIWNGIECHCWHDHLNLYLVLGFLDGLSPQDIAKKEFPYFPEVLLKFKNEGNPAWSHHEWFVNKQNSIWNHYGQRLFEFYDIRSPSLWNQYIDFIKEFHALKEKKVPPDDYFDHKRAYPANIC